jgi:hypothetical protein
MEMRVGRVRNGTLYFYVELQEIAVDTDSSQQLQSTKSDKDRIVRVILKLSCGM